jgi:major inositol transporter-like SP family MFS transporter
MNTVAQPGPADPLALLSLSHSTGDSTPPRSRRSLKVITAIATLGGLCFGYDTGVISGALLYLSEDLNLTPFAEGVVTSSLLVGAAFGAVLGGRLSDRYGRRRNILTLAILFIVGALGTALAPNVSAMVAFRIVLGLAVGTASVTVPVYIAELSPHDRRERMVTYNELMIVSGQLLAYATNAAISATTDDAGHAWRWMLAIPTLPAVALWIGMLFMPESPRWYAAKGRFHDMQATLLRIRDPKDVDAEAQEIIATAADEDRQRGSLADFREPWVRRLVLLGILIVGAAQLTGVNTIMYYAPTVLKVTGLGTQASLTATIANGVISVLATLIGIVIVGKFPRRRMFIVGQIGVTTSLILIGLAFLAFFQTAANGDLVARFPAASYLVLALMLVFLTFMQGFIAPVFWLMLSEIFPLRIRGLAMGAAVFVLWMINFTIALVFPVLLDTIGGSGTFAVFGVTNIIMLTLITKFLPETRGKSLEQLEFEFKARYGARRTPEADSTPTSTSSTTTASH